jgi:Tol biopolymer transport system component
MPYVEGRSLRDRITREGALPIDDAVRILRDVVDALTEAHARGVVHRDIKPENILLRGRHALVTDFGVAKAVSDATGRTPLTTAGVALGTPAYMAPEQASADPNLDHRVDIYALGAVGYELLAGRPVFAGTTPQMVLAAHMTEAPEPVTGHRAAVPPALDALVMRCLAKKPADRFQRAEDLLPLLEGLATPSGGSTPTATPAATGTLLGRKLGWGIAIAAVLAIAAAALTRVIGSDPLLITTANSRAVTREPGVELQPALSPDGREVAYVERRTQGARIVVRSTVDLASEGASRPAAVEAEQWFPAWTPDGAALRFLVCGARPRWVDSDCAIREVGTRGGAVRAIGLPRESVRYVWSRDGARVAFATQDSVYAFDAGGGTPELVGVVPVNPMHGGTHSLAWSPDGRHIALVSGNPDWRTSVNVLPASIWVLDADGGDPVRVTDDSTMNVSPQWLPDGRHLLFISDRAGQREVYVVEVGPSGPRGDPRKVAGPVDAHSISISWDGRRLAYARFNPTQNIVAVPIPAAGAVSLADAVPVTTGTQVVEHLSVSPDGEWIVFASNRGDGQDLYKLRLDGGSPELVVDIEGDAFEPEWSADGSEIVFYSSLTEEGLMVVSADGGATERITDPVAAGPAWSPDGLTIAFWGGPSGEDASELNVWLVSREAIGGAWGAPVQLTDFGCSAPDWAPDGASLTCLRLGRGGWVRVSVEGDVLARYEPATFGLAEFTGPVFSRDGSGFYTLGTGAAGSSGIWWIPAAGDRATRVVALDDASQVLWSPQVGVGHLYLVVAEHESDIWVTDLEW